MKRRRIVVNEVELRLITDNRENNDDDQPTIFHLSRWLNSKKRVTATACGRAGFKGLVWDFYSWIHSHEEVMCEECLERVEVKKGLFGHRRFRGQG